MSDTSRLYTLENVVDRAIAAGGYGRDKFMRFLQLAVDGLRELNLSFTPSGEKWLKVTPDSLNRVSMPSDMIDLIGVGVPVNGRLYLLTEDNRIIRTYTESESGQLSLDSTDGEGVALPTEQLPTIRATGGINAHGYYTVDWDNDVIIVNATSRSELLLVYTTSGTKLNEITYVPTLYVNALVAYILWQDVETDPRASEQLVMRFNARWVRETRKLAKGNMSIDKLRDTFASTYSMLRR